MNRLQSAPTDLSSEAKHLESETDRLVCKAFCHFDQETLNALREAVLLANRDYAKHAETIVLWYTEEDREKSEAKWGIDGNREGWTVADCFRLFEDLWEFVRGGR